MGYGTARGGHLFCKQEIRWDRYPYAPLVQASSRLKTILVYLVGQQRDILYRPVVKWLNTTVSKTVDPRFESESGDFRQANCNFSNNRKSLLLFIDEVRVVLLILCPLSSKIQHPVQYMRRCPSGLWCDPAKVVTGDRPKVQILPVAFAELL